MSVSLEDLQKVELQLAQGSHDILTLFWMCMKYTQAMLGSPQVALRYVDLLIQCGHQKRSTGFRKGINVQARKCITGRKVGPWQAGRNVTRTPAANQRKLIIQTHRRCSSESTSTSWPLWLSAELARLQLERAVVLRLLHRHDEALQELDAFLNSTSTRGVGGHHDALMQRSCVKHSMDDRHGALEDAAHAQRLHPSAAGLFLLAAADGIALPHAYREWLRDAPGNINLTVPVKVETPRCDTLAALRITGFKMSDIDMSDIESGIRFLTVK